MSLSVDVEVQASVGVRGQGEEARRRLLEAEALEEVSLDRLPRWERETPRGTRRRS